ncbi:MAG: LON peptidase substrate-binding domain-containing protein, partial [Gemmata sp.]
MTEDCLRDFAGTVRLFPLPNLVVFPHVVQGLHVFEPRYRRMTADALAGDRLIGMALLTADADDPA